MVLSLALVHTYTHTHSHTHTAFSQPQAQLGHQTAAGLQYQGYSLEGKWGGGRPEAGLTGCVVRIAAKLQGGRRGILLVLSLFVSQGSLSLHLLTLWEAQVGPGRHSGGALGAGGGRRFQVRQAWPYQFYHLRGARPVSEGENSPAQGTQPLQSSGERREVRGQQE